jgi:transposase
VARTLLAPNPENATLVGLQVAMRAGDRDTYRRCLVIIMLLTGSSRDKVIRAFDLCGSTVQKIIRDGVDSLIVKRRTGRIPLITGEADP